MGGGHEKSRHGDKKAEHNIRYDIEAAQKVFYSDWSKRYVLGDTTYDERLSVDESKQFFKAIEGADKPHLDVLVKSMRAFFTGTPFPNTLMHDPLTVSSVITPEYVQFATKKVHMDDKGIMRERDDGIDTVVSVGADYEGFREFFNARILK